MCALSVSVLAALRSSFRTRAALQLEILALRHQINVLRRSQRGRVHLRTADRLLWTWLMRLWPGWRSALAIVKPETVIAWHRKGFRLYWTWKSRHGQPGRPALAKGTRELIRKMSLANPLWGARRIHGELLKLGYAERPIGSIRRECLDHIIVLNETCLRWTLRSYFAYYLHARTHLA